MKFNENHKDTVQATMNKNIEVGGDIEKIDNWLFVHRGPDGEIKDEFTIYNRIVSEGLDYALGSALNGSTQITTWYIGLTDSTPTTAAGDTISSHGGWTEVTSYSETDRQEWTPGSISSQTISNSGSPATFTFSSDGITVGGAFLVSDNTKGGTSGTLFAVGAFEKGDKNFDTDDTIEVTAQFSNSYSA